MTHPSSLWTPTSDLIDRIIDLARQAGQMALTHFRQITFQLKADQTFVTQVDHDIEQFLVEQLRELFPTHSFLAEESAWGPVDPARPIWVIDPLDGTTAFIQGLPGWGISIGLLQQGYPVFGLFYLPLTDDLIYTGATNTIIANGQLLPTVLRQDWQNNGFLAVNTTAHQKFQLDVPRLRAMGSVGANLVYTIRGAATAALIPMAYIWDLAAGAAILRRAGGELRYLSGAPVELGPLLNGQLAPEPIIAGHPQVLTALQHAIKIRWPDKEILNDTQP
jgi:myo-inositol-1(or 4)-monophosphatase